MCSIFWFKFHPRIQVFIVKLGWITLMWPVQSVCVLVSFLWILSSIFRLNWNCLSYSKTRLSSLTQRIPCQVITHKVVRCEIKIQLFLKFRWHDPIGLWYIISHFYYLNWEGFYKIKIIRPVMLGLACREGKGGTSVEYNF